MGVSFLMIAYTSLIPEWKAVTTNALLWRDLRGFIDATYTTNGTEELTQDVQMANEWNKTFQPPSKAKKQQQNAKCCFTQRFVM